jgi:hypothetical protein
VRRAEEADFEPNDLADVRGRYRDFLALIDQVSAHENGELPLPLTEAAAGREDGTAGASARPGGPADTLAGPLPGAR